MKTGYFLKVLDLYGEDPDDWDWDFLSDVILCEDLEFSVYDFIHGCCVDFAKMLNQKLSYPVEIIFDEYDGCVAHAYCTCIIDGKKHFIDARGITDDFSSFIAEFDDWISSREYPCENTTRCDKCELPGCEVALQAADMLFERHKDFYFIGN